MAATIARDSTLYDGIRHLEFIQPVIVVLAIAGWAGALSRSRPLRVRAAAAVTVTVGLASLLVFHWRFHPNQRVYFNSVVGGPGRAVMRYDMDYWGNCVLQALQWSAELARDSRIPLAISGNPAHLVQLNSERFSELYFTFPSHNRHHVHVRLARGSRAAIRELVDQPALHQVRTPDGAVLCTVIPGPAFQELERYRRRAPR